MDEEEIKIKMDDGVAGFFTRFGGAQPCLAQNEIVVS